MTGEHGGHGSAESHDELDGIPRISDLKPHSRGFMWTIVIAIPFILLGLAAVQLLEPRLGVLGSWYLGLALVMVPAGIIMVRAVWHSTKSHEEPY